MTYNLSDFPQTALGRYGIEALHPDEFILRLLGMDQEKVHAAVRDQRLSLRHPPKTAEEMLDTFAQQKLTKTVAALRPFLLRL